jgi:magnesium chelatase family protein
LETWICHFLTKEGFMITRAYNVCFQGMDPQVVDVECAITNGLPAFSIVGLPDKAVSEARERIRAAFSALSIALPSKRITVNLTPADHQKEGSHLDLPIALALLAALDIVPKEKVENAISIGEISLDGRLNAVSGALPTALKAAELEKALLCPNDCGNEAAWIDTTRVIAAPSLLRLIQHLNGQSPIEPSEPRALPPPLMSIDMQDVKGQQRAKRALEISAAGRHHILMVGTPGAGKSMLAARLPTILPPMTARDALETTMIHSLSGVLETKGMQTARPFREPHHRSSMAAIVGGGRSAKPGEISLAHDGVLFMDEFPKFPRHVLETLRQPIETGEVMIARANAHVKYPCRFTLVAAANPCRCGYMTQPDRACSRAPNCGAEYMDRISGPLMDRFDIRIEVPPVSFRDLTIPNDGDTSAAIAQRVLVARQIQIDRLGKHSDAHTNADLTGTGLETALKLDPEGHAYLQTAAEKLGLSARGYHRIMRVARTIADLDQSYTTQKSHIAEAISFRLTSAASKD